MALQAHYDLVAMVAPSIGIYLLGFHDGFGDLSAIRLREGDINHLAFVLPDFVVHGLAIFLFDCDALLLESKGRKITCSAIYFWCLLNCHSPSG